MTHFLRISVHFLDPAPAFHGRRDGSVPEWPPSPLRLFQALLDAAANRWRNVVFQEYAKPALVWLERQPLPTLIAPKHFVGTPFRIAVPNNDLDSPARIWARGQEPVKPHRPVDLRTMKTVHPTHLRGTNEDENAIHYLYPLSDSDPEFERHRGTLQAAANSITHLGWGVDMAVGDAKVVTQEEADRLPGERWQPVPVGGTPLRVPVDGTLADLANKHELFLSRLPSDGFKPVPPLSAFRVVGYQRRTERSQRSFAAFEIWRPLAELAGPAKKSRFRPFDTVRQFAHVAGMVRHATADAARLAGWDEARVNSFILGHEDGKPATTTNRLMFVPLPSITPLKVESIRRVLVVGPAGTDISRIRQLLSGRELIAEGRFDPVAMLSVISESDNKVAPYIGPARVWSTVTPVMLPGYDDPDGLRKKLRDCRNPELQRHLLERLYRRIIELIKKAFNQAGWPNELVEHAELEYREVGFRPGVDLARRYELPPMKFPRYHVRVRFRHPIHGPLVIGGGRWRGLGVFAAEKKE